MDTPASVAPGRANARTAGAGGPSNGIGVTGQMHGMALISSEGAPVSPFIGWQDQRCQEMLSGRDVHYIDRMMQLGGITTVIVLACMMSVFWLREKRMSKRTVPLGA